MNCFGIDIHKDYYQVALIDSQGVIHEVRIETTRDGKRELAHWVASVGSSKVAMESCTGSYHLYDILAEKCPDSQVFILDGRKLKERFPKKGRKTDKIDALNLARAAGYDDVAKIWIPGAQVRRNRLLSSHRCHLLDQEIEERNRLHAALRDQGIRLPFKSGRLWSQEGRAWLSAQCQKFFPELRQEIEFGLKRIDLIEEQLRELEIEIARWACDSAEAQLIMTIPGVGPTGAFTILAEVGEASRFENPKQLIRIAGLDPRVSQSGGSCYHGSISKRGRSRLRWIAVECALSCRRYCPTLRSFHDRILKRSRSSGKAKVATGRKLLALCWYILKSGRAYNHEKPELTQSKISRAKAIAKRTPGRKPRKRSFTLPLDLAT